MLVPSASLTARLAFGASSWFLAMLMAANPRAPTVGSITQSTPYSILGVTPVSSRSQVDDAYDDLLQTLEKQNKKGLWSKKGDQELLSIQKAELHDAYITITDPLERCYWHRDTGVRDWYGVPALCWDEIVRDKLQMLRDAIAQEDFSKLTWLPRSSTYSPFPIDQNLQQPEQATETSIKQEMPATKTKTSGGKTSPASSNTEAAAKITLESTSIKANGNTSAKVDWVFGLLGGFTQEIPTVLGTFIRKVSTSAGSAIGTLSYPVTVAVPRLRSWLGISIPVLHSKISTITQSVHANLPILVFYPEAVLVQARSWLVNIWAWICLVITTVWSYLITCSKLVRNYLMALAPSPSSDTMFTANGPQPTINSQGGEKATILTKLASLRPSFYGTVTTLTPSTTNPLRYQSQSRSHRTRVVTVPVLFTQPTSIQVPVKQ